MNGWTNEWKRGTRTKTIFNSKDMKIVLPSCFMLFYSHPFMSWTLDNEAKNYNFTYHSQWSVTLPAGQH